MATALIIASPVSAVLIVNDNFDGYADQAAFQAAWPAIGTSVTNPSALLSTTQSLSAPNSISVPGTAANNEYRNRRSFAETGIVDVGGSQIIWSFDFYDSTGTGNPQRNFANLQDSLAPSGTPQLISMGLNNNLLANDQGGNYYMARILGGASNGGTASAYFKLNDPGAPLRSVGWHNLKVILTTSNGASTDFRFYVDNILAETVLNVGTVLRSYDNIAIGSGLSNGSTAAYFDNMRLEFIASVPEASSFLAVGLAAAVAGGAKWYRRRRTA